MADPTDNPETTTTEGENTPPEQDAELVDVEVEPGAFVTDGAGRVGVLVADDRPGRVLGDGESPEPMIAWLGTAEPYGGDLTAL